MSPKHFTCIEDEMRHVAHRNERLAAVVLTDDEKAIGPKHSENLEGA